MKCVLEINLDNAAFHPDPTTEIVQILDNVASHINVHGFDSDTRHQIRDTNGNLVGLCSCEQE